MTRVLARHVQITDGRLRVEATPLIDYAGSFSYSVTGGDGTLIAGERDLPIAPASPN
jgi:hypothetical protein